MSKEGLSVIVVLILSAVIFLLILALRKNGRGSSKGRISSEEELEEARPKGTNCPLCGELLTEGRKVHSEIFPGKDFDLMRIYGCPYCRNGDSAHKRRCPYCKEVVPSGGYVMAQVYRKPYKPPHVHVYGCTRCKHGRG